MVQGGALRYMYDPSIDGVVSAVPRPVEQGLAIVKFSHSVTRLQSQIARNARQASFSATLRLVWQCACPGDIRLI